MKQIIRFSVSLILVFSLLLAALPVSASPATSGKLDNCNISWSFDTATGHFTLSGSGKMPYTQFAPAYLRFDEEIKTVSIAHGITRIGEMSFSGCSNLVSVTIPETVTEIGLNAFAYCESLKSVKLPSNLTVLASGAFQYCESLTSIDIPASLKVLTDDVFYGCDRLTQVTLHEGLESIGAYAFQALPIRSITIPRSVKSIGEYAFHCCYSLKQVNLQEGLQEIKERAFSLCNSLKTLTLPSSLQRLWDGAFTALELDTLVIKSKYCKLGDNDVHLLGDGNTVVYGYPDSTADRYIKTYVNCGYTFKPMYFNDVAPGVWYFDAVTYAKENSLFDGVGNDRFAPEDTMTRAMMVQVLYNYAGKGEICENPFADVPNNTWYTNAVAWAAKNGIVNGVGDGNFNPEGKLTREQLASIMFRFTTWQEEDTSKADALDGFADTRKVSEWALPAMKWSVGQGLINGVDQNGQRYLQPQAYASRAQVATILMRHLETLKEINRIDLTVWAEGGTMNTVKAAAEAFMRAEENKYIVITVDEYNAYGNDYHWFKGNQSFKKTIDMFISPESATGAYFEEQKLVENEDAIDFACSPYVFAVTKDNPKQVKDLADLIARVKSRELSIRFVLDNMKIGSYARTILPELGIPESSFGSLKLETSLTSSYAADLINEWYTDCGIVRKHDASHYGLTMFDPPEGHEDSDLITAYIMNTAPQKETAQRFADFLKQYTEDGALMQYGFEPITQ